MISFIINRLIYFLSPIRNNNVKEENKKNFTYFPINLPEIEKLFEKQQECLWTDKECNFSDDKKDLEKLTKEEQRFIKHILIFFAMSDGIVSENLMKNFTDEIDIPEAQHFFSIQNYIENVHAKTYSIMVDSLMTNEEKNIIFNDINQYKVLKRKKEWMLKWLNRDVDILLRIVAFCCIEGIFFSGSFASMFWLGRRGLTPGLVFANKLISRDENLHLNAGYKFFKIMGGTEKLSDPQFIKNVKQIILEAEEIEKEFLTDCMGKNMLGLNCNDMLNHIHYVSRSVNSNITNEKLDCETPLDWIKNYHVHSNENFFEQRSSTYKNFSTGENGLFSLTTIV
jgi:ribonucleotide reductase beta subunit family protein with ferritin-like domain